jgi:hypothetical protein
MVLTNALAYNMEMLITSVIVTASHFHPSIIFEVKARSFLREAYCSAIKCYVRVEIDHFIKCTSLQYGNINYQCVCHCQPFPPNPNIWEHCPELAQGGFLPSRKILG